MKIAIRRFGYSKGIIVPAEILSQVGLEGVADIRLKNASLIISPPKKRARFGRAKASQKLAVAGDDSLVLPEPGNVSDADLRW
jgi:antitoxin MazE